MLRKRHEFIVFGIEHRCGKDEQCRLGKNTCNAEY